jgi:hypothetical protein
MPDTDSLALRAFRALLDLHDDLMAAGLAEAGYHALTAAMHCAEATGNREQLRLVLERAELRQRQVDALQPSHRLSSKQAEWRTHTPVFASLAVSTNAVLVRLKADAVRAQSMAKLR